MKQIPEPPKGSWMPDVNNDDALPAPSRVAFDHELENELQVASAAWVRKSRQPDRPWTAEMILDIYYEYKRQYVPKQMFSTTYDKFKVMSRIALGRVAGTKEDAKKIMMYLFKISTSTQADEIMFSFIVDWTGVSSENQYAPVPQAFIEAKRLAKAWDDQQKIQTTIF